MHVFIGDREGLRLVEEREAKLLALRGTLEASIAQGGEVTDAELDAALAAKSAELRGMPYEEGRDIGAFFSGSDEA